MNWSGNDSRPVILGKKYMDLYQATVDYLLNFPIFREWRDMESILRRAASEHPRDWELPIILCQAFGASPKKAIPASAALACGQISIILVDDMLDNDPRGEYHHIGHGRAANFALAFQAAGVDSILGSRSSSKVRSEAANSLNQMMYRTAFGQELDVKNPNDEISYWRVVENKSAPFYGCAFHLGALFGGAHTETADSLKRLGRLYGEMIQIHDDMNDTMAIPANSDWFQKRKPLPILFTQTVEHPERVRFIELCKNISAGDALQEAQEILIRCGAVSYCVDALLRKHQAVRAILDKLTLSNKGLVAALINDLVAPVHKLFKTLGIPYQTVATFPTLLNLE
jgi:geranylgeranyl pyrophosphate synthase